MEGTNTMSDLSREDALALARRAFNSFGISASAEIEFVKHRENVVFRVSDAGGSYALRIHRLGHRSDAEVRTESAYMAALGEAGLPVPEVVPSLDGGLFAVVPDRQGRGHHVDLQRWVEDSVPLGDAAEAWAGKDRLDAEAFEQLGELCGRLHATARDLGRIPGYSRQAWDSEGLSGPAPLWGDPRRLAETDEDRTIIAEALAAIRTHLARLGT